jgi:hypothetical protein
MIVSLQSGQGAVIDDEDKSHVVVGTLSIFPRYLQVNIHFSLSQVNKGKIIALNHSAVGEFTKRMPPVS